ncbi:MAG: DUF4082 domain-containing protein, partial [Propionibacterium sp.]|nr:DUF4082 domain-containing protein [Propionibacterium sp.]
MIRIRPVRRIRTDNQSTRPSRRTLTALAASFTLLVVGALLAPTTILANASSPSGVGLFNDSVKPENSATSDKTSANLGVKFSSDTSGSVTGLQFYRSDLQKQAYTASLWDLNGTLLSQTTFPASSSEGWQTAALPDPVKVNKGRWYVASYLASDGQYVSTDDVFGSNWSKSPLNARKHGGTKVEATGTVIPKTTPKADRGTSFLVDVVFDDSNSHSAPAPQPTEVPSQPAEPKPTPSETTAPRPEPTPTESTAPEPTPSTPAEPTPAPSPSETETSAPEPTPSTPAEPEPTPEPSRPAQPGPSNPGNGERPGPNNTGVPAGVSLSAYTGPMTITADNTVIRDRVVNGTLRIQASNVQIINSRINGGVDLRSPRTNDYSFTIVDSEVHIGDNLNTG